MGVGRLVAVVCAAALLLMFVGGVRSLQCTSLCFETANLLRKDLELVVVVLCLLRWVDCKPLLGVTA